MTTNQKKYTQKIFAFLDILGFEELVNESRKNPELINRIANMLRRSKKVAVSSINARLTVLRVDPTQYRHLAFSDTSVISGPYTSHDDIDFLATWIIMYEYLMWKEERTFVRGAIVYGAIYEDEDVLFGPALIDAYHLERDKDKAVWPRVLIDKSLLAKITETESKRDFFEFMRRDDNLVYLDYLRELFHYLVLVQGKRVTGERHEDFGPPAKLFEDHKEAIITQVQKNKNDTNIHTKYLKLSEYHNSIIDTLRLVINNLMTDNSPVRDCLNELLKCDFAKWLGIEYKTKYSAEDNPEQADTLNILGAAIGSVLTALPDKELEYAMTDTFNVIATICRDIPQKLATLDMRLKHAIIDIDSLL